MPEYTLPDLPYDYAALEPHYSAEILELHHDKHHATYVKGANTALDKLAAARENEDFGTINQLQKNLAFNLSGHVLHSLFWKNMSPHGGDKPDGELAAAIDESFGTFEGFRNQLTEAALNVQGSGWGALDVGAASRSGSSSSRSTTTRATSARARRRSSCSTCGSTRTTCSTRT